MKKTKKSTAKKMTKKEFGTMGKTIMTEAKRIRKASPGKKWTNCVKEAGRKYKG